MKSMRKRPKAATVKSTPDDPEQSRAFIEKAREIGADEERSKADTLIGHLARKPPEPKTKSKR
jgi:hypothetical protein